MAGSRLPNNGIELIEQVQVFRPGKIFYPKRHTGGKFEFSIPQTLKSANTTENFFSNELF